MFKRFGFIFVAMCVTTLLSGVAIGQNGEKRIAEISNDGGSVSWRVLVPHKSVMLTVSTPDGTVFRREFKSGTKPVFSLTNKNGEFYGDGSFNYELVVSPDISSDVKEQMLASRENGNSDAVARDLRKSGLIPESASESGNFRVVSGQLFTKNDPGVDTAEPQAFEGGTDPETPQTKSDKKTPEADSSGSSLAPGDFVIADDLIVQSSTCTGFDCVNGESFGFDTLRLKENNLRIHFQDTSSSASFPTADWRIQANDSSNGGGEYLGIQDVDNGTFPFRVFKGAGNDALIVRSGGNVGFGTAVPVVDLHVKTGNTPTLRLDQDGSQGFTPQVWDIAGNETNFFIRDATNGSRLPLRIRPSAPSSSIDVAGSGDIGFGTTTPDARAHVIGKLLVDNVDGGAIPDLNVAMAVRDNDSRVQVQFLTTNSDWQLIAEDDGTANQGLSFTRAGTGVRELRISPTGQIFVNGTMLNVPDYVFEDDYKLMPLDELADFIRKNKHLPNVQNAADAKANGLEITGLMMRLLEKVEELTLYTISQKEALDIRAQEAATQKAEIAELKALVKSLIDK